MKHIEYAVNKKQRSEAHESRRLPHGNVAQSVPHQILYGKNYGPCHPAGGADPAAGPGAACHSEQAGVQYPRVVRRNPDHPEQRLYALQKAGTGRFSIPGTQQGG